jgi:hypothetical protein
MNNKIKSKTNVDLLIDKDKLPDGMENYINKKIGGKKVVEYLGVRKTKNKKYSVWKYICNCGAEGITSNNTLKYYPSNYCSKCMHHELRKSTPIDMGDYYSLKTHCGYEYFIDKEDYEKIKNYTWHKHKDGYLRTRYDVVDGKNKYILLHNLLLDRYEKLDNDVDHINRKPYDNRRSNLRIVTHAENMRNISIRKDSKSGVLGVHYSKTEEKWKSFITYNKERTNLGTFNNKEDAIMSRLNKEYELFGDNSAQYELMIKYGIVKE